MMTINLVDLDKSDVKYKISKFPDGQQQITIIGFKEGDSFKWEDPLLAYPITIKSRLNSFKDLELIICTKKALDYLGFNNINLYIPYFLGCRSDRKFEDGSNNYLKDVICPIINSLNFDSVTVMDPHSDVLEACLNNFKKQSLGYFYDWCYREMGSKDFVLISPDGGSLKKIYKVAEQIRYKGDIITCSKSRDKDGGLTETKVPIKYNHWKENESIIIVDDICDGGRTFINIAKEIKLKDIDNRVKLYLIVTHGIFSSGNEELEKYFDYIYCTNSYKDVDGKINRVKQLNVF